MLYHCLVAVALWTLTAAEYDCVCSYDVERKVFASPDVGAMLLGYMYEFDCKKTAAAHAPTTKFTAIEYQHKLGYVAVDINLQGQICPGDPPAADLLLTTTTQPSTSLPTTTMPRLSTLTRLMSTQRMTSTSTYMPTASIPTTTVPATTMPTTSNPTTTMPTTTMPTTSKPTTNMPTTKMPTTSNPTTTMPTTTMPTTSNPTTTMPTTTMPTTSKPTTTMPKTTMPITNMPTTSRQTTSMPTTSRQTTSMPTTTMPTTSMPSTSMPTKPMSTTVMPTTRMASTAKVSTSSSTSMQTTELETSTQPTTRPSSTTTSPVTTTIPPPTFPTLTNLAPTLNPLRFLGVGYSLLDANPGAADVTMYGSGRGPLPDRRILQLTQANNAPVGTAREANISTHNTCLRYDWSKFLHDGRSYLDELKTFVQFGDTSPMLVDEAFKFNAEFNRIRQDTEGATSAVYRDMLTFCSLGSMRYQAELASANHFSISRDFATDVCTLPNVFDAVTYLKFIDKWGTNIVMSSEIGTLTLERYKTSAQQVMLQLQKHGLDNMIYPSISYQGYGSSVSINATEVDSANLPMFGVKMNTNVIGKPDAPAPIRITLASITEALQPKYWTQVLRLHLFTDVCSDVVSEAFLQQMANNLNKTLQQYVSYRRSKEVNIVPVKDQPMTIPMTWPYGTYGLMQATTGCPSSKVPWGDGYRKYDTEDTSAHNYFSDRIEQYMAGDFGNNIVTRFCMKTTASVESKYDRAWPSGNYCILQRGVCPLGFKSGSIFWDDQDISNDNEAKGVIPDGEYNHNTKIYYCCRNDGSLSQPILLPREKPFVLIRYGTSCQAVYGMTVTEVIIRWDDEDLFNSDDSSGAHPFDDGGSKDHKLHFCHYRERPMGNQPGIIG